MLAGASFEVFFLTSCSLRSRRVVAVALVDLATAFNDGDTWEVFHLGSGPDERQRWETMRARSKASDFTGSKTSKT